MEIQSFVDLIQSVGFPIAVVSYYLWKDYKKENQLSTAVTELSITLAKFGEKIDNMNENCNRKLDR